MKEAKFHNVNFHQKLLFLYIIYFVSFMHTLRLRRSFSVGAVFFVGKKITTMDTKAYTKIHEEVIVVNEKNGN